METFGIINTIFITWHLILFLYSMFSRNNTIRIFCKNLGWITINPVAMLLTFITFAESIGKRKFKKCFIEFCYHDDII